MAIIDPRGLTNGERLRACSDLARLWWPILFLQANSLGRFEVNYQANVLAAGFRRPPPPERYHQMLGEYRDNYLLFLYSAPDGSAWGQWYAKPGTLPSHKRRDELDTPAPPLDEFDAWCQEYAQRKRQQAAAAFGDIPVARTTPRVSDVPTPLVAAVLRVCREAYPDTTESLARQITMAALAVRPKWTAQEVGIHLRLAQKREQRGAALFLRTLPPVLRALDATPKQASLPLAALDDTPDSSGLSDEQIAEMDRLRIRRIVGG